MGELAGNIKTILSVAKFKLPSLLGTLNHCFQFQEKAAPPVLKLTIWLENPAEVCGDLYD